MADEVRVVTSQSWISRIFGSIGGAFIGMALVLVSIVLLFWNEGRYVETYKTLSPLAQWLMGVQPLPSASRVYSPAVQEQVLIPASMLLQV